MDATNISLTPPTLMDREIHFALTFLIYAAPTHDSTYESAHLSEEQMDAKRLCVGHPAAMSVVETQSELTPNNIMINANSLEKEIFDAFEMVLHPGNEKLLRSDGIDDSDISFLYCFENKSWRDIEPVQLTTESSCLNALSDEGLMYIIPAYIRLFLMGIEDNVGWEYRLLYILSEQGRGNLLLNDDQFRVIDNIFLKPIKSDWEQYKSSCFGYDLGELVNIVRKKYCS